MFLHKYLFLLIFSFLSIPIELWESTAAIFRQSAGYVLQLKEFSQFKEFELFWGVLFFKICSLIFKIFECLFLVCFGVSQIGVFILVTPIHEVERKSECLCGVKLFDCNFKVDLEIGVLTIICFLAGGFLFLCGMFTLIFTVF